MKIIPWLHNRTLPYLGLVAACLAGSLSAHGQVIIQHNGSTDPATEGFTLSGNELESNSLTIGAVTTPEAAWEISNDGTDALSRAFYQYNFTTANFNLANAAGGLLLSTRIMVPVANQSITDSGSLVDFQTANAFSPGQARYSIRFGSNADGHLLVRLGSQTTIDVGAGGFHDVDLFVSADDGLSQLIINGTMVLENIAGSSANIPGSLRFGGIAAGHAGSTYFGEVTITAVPEPATVALIMGGLVLVWVCVRRKLGA